MGSLSYAKNLSTTENKSFLRVSLHRHCGCRLHHNLGFISWQSLPQISIYYLDRAALSEILLESKVEADEFRVEASSIFSLLI